MGCNDKKKLQMVSDKNYYIEYYVELFGSVIL